MLASQAFPVTAAGKIHLLTVQLLLQQVAHSGYEGCCETDSPDVFMCEEEQGSLLQEPPQCSVMPLQKGGGGGEVEHLTLC